ncbi:MAG TPA: hypothetical protein VF803_00035, partial [Candidatus Paceibacterota bacterium]
AEQPPVFKIADGPVVGATLAAGGASTQIGAPTTTVARYVTALDGHVLEVPLDVPGAAPRTISNTTIPGIERAFFTEGGRGVIVQYLEGSTIKTAHLALSAALATTSVSGPSIRFLPDGVAAIAVSRDGASVAYALPRNTGGAQAGLTLYTARADGSSPVAVGSTPLPHIQLSWPSKGALLFYTNSATGIDGIVFSIDLTKGGTSALLSGQGITATADPSFSFLLHLISDGTRSSLFAEDLKSGATSLVPGAADSLGAPLPETCVWGGTAAANAVAYCAAPSAAAAPNYLDMWHSGEASSESALVSIDLRRGAVAIATPGSRDGGEPSDMISLALSPDSRYLSFIAKDDETLWGVRLGTSQ